METEKKKKKGVKKERKGNSLLSLVCVRIGMYITRKGLLLFLLLAFGMQLRTVRVQWHTVGREERGRTGAVFDIGTHTWDTCMPCETFSIVAQGILITLYER